MKIKLSIALLITALILSTKLYAGELPAKLDMVYRANISGINIGTLERQLLSLGEAKYRVSSHTNATGIAALLLKDTYREKSEFKVEGNTLYPLSYHQAPDNKPEKARIANFDWVKKKVTLNNDRVYDISPGIQDPSTFLFFWMLSPPKVGQNGSVSLIDGKRLKQFDYDVIGIEEIESLWGEINALRIERKDKNDPEKVVRLWLATGHQNIPVKIENIRPKYKMTFTLEKVEGI